MAFPIFEKVGGSDIALATLAAAFGKPPTKFVQDKWRAKRALPFKAQVPLISECQRRGIPWTDDDLKWRDDVPLSEAAE